MGRGGEALGAGEILLTSMDTDGVQTGFDCASDAQLCARRRGIPVIASGGAGKPEDFYQVLADEGAGADAALAASSFTTERTPSAISRTYLQERKVPGAHMIFPCIDLMDGKVVQLVQGRDKALEGDAPLEMLRKFAAFPEIQVIDLDAAMGRGENSALVELLACRARCRVGGGVRRCSARATAHRARSAPDHRRNRRVHARTG